MTDETWVSVSAAARHLGEHRQQLLRMLKSGRIPRRLVRGTPPQLRLEGLAEAVRAGKRQRIDSRPCPPLKPVPVPAPVPAAELQLQRLQREVEQARDREQAWLGAYGELRQWADETMALDLMRELPDPAPVGQVMSVARDLLLQRLAALERCGVEARSRG